MTKMHHSLFLVINAFCKKGIRDKLTEAKLLLPRKLWNTHINFIFVTLHFVLITKIVWNCLLSISQQTPANMKAAWRRLLPAYHPCVQSQAWKNHNAYKCPELLPSQTSNQGANPFQKIWRQIPFLTWSFGPRTLTDPAESCTGCAMQLNRCASSSSEVPRSLGSLLPHRQLLFSPLLVPISLGNVEMLQCLCSVLGPL